MFDHIPLSAKEKTQLKKIRTKNPAHISISSYKPILSFSFIFLTLFIAFLYISLNVYLGIAPGKKSQAAHLTWAIETVDNRGFTGYGSSVYQDGTTRYISYVDVSNNDLYFARYTGTGTETTCVGNTNWRCEIVDPNASVDETSLAFVSGGQPAIAYNGSTTLKYANYIGGGTGTCSVGSNWNCETVDIAPNTLADPSLVNLANIPHISYRSDTGQSLKYARRVGGGTGNCSAGSNWNCEIVNTSSAMGQYSSIADNGSGSPIISYYDEGNGDLKFALSVNAGSGTGCISSNFTCTTVQSAGDAGRWTSIFLNTSGQAAISYLDTTTNALKVAENVGSGGTGCAVAQWKCSTVDSGIATRFTSLTRQSGSLIISYVDFTNGRLKYAQQKTAGTGNCIVGGDYDCEIIQSGITPQYTSVVTSSTTTYISYYEDGTRSLRFATGNPVNTAPVAGYTADNVIPSAQISQATDATGIVNITFKLKDGESNTITLNTFQYSVDGGTTWTAPTNGDSSASLNGGNYISGMSSPLVNWRTNGSSYASATSFASATTYFFHWNTKHADVTGINGTNQIDIRVRFTANDGTVNSSSPGTADNFAVDNLAPTTATNTNIVTRANAGATTVLMSVAFTETNPNTNVFSAQTNDGGYGANTSGSTNTATPSNQATTLAVALDGDDCVTDVRAIHTDDFGNTVTAENIAPSNACVIPYTPATPTGSVNGSDSLRVMVQQNTSETGAVQYAIRIRQGSSEQFLQTTGTLGASAAWQVYSSWGGATGIGVTGLSSGTIYTIDVKARNPNEPTTTESGYSSTLLLTTTTSARRSLVTSEGTETKNTATNTTKPEPVSWKQIVGSDEHPYDEKYDIVLEWSDPVCNATNPIIQLDILRDNNPTPNVFPDVPLKSFSITNCVASSEKYIDSAVSLGKTYQYLIRVTNNIQETTLSSLWKIRIPPLYTYVTEMGNYPVMIDATRFALMTRDANTNVQEYLEDIFGSAIPDNFTSDEMPSQDSPRYDEQDIQQIEQELTNKYEDGEITNLVLEEEAEEEQKNTDNTLVVAQNTVDEIYITVGNNQNFEISGNALPYSTNSIRIYEAGKIALDKESIASSQGIWQVTFSSISLAFGVHELTLLSSFEQNITPEVRIGILYVREDKNNIPQTTSDTDTNTTEGESESPTTAQEPSPNEQETISTPVTQLETGQDENAAPLPVVSSQTTAEETQKKEQEKIINELQIALEIPTKQIMKEFVGRIEPVISEFEIKNFPQFLKDIKVLYDKTKIDPGLINTSLETKQRKSRRRMTDVLIDPYKDDIKNELYCKMNQIGTRFRLENNRLVDKTIDEQGNIREQMSPKAYEYLSKRYWSGRVRLELLKRINHYFTKVEKMGGKIERVYKDLSVDELDTFRVLAQTGSPDEIADFNTWLHILQPIGKNISRGVSETLIALGAEVCHYVPTPQLPAVKTTSQTSNKKLYQNIQGYLQAAPLGLNIEYAWTFPGGRGKNVKIIDIEGGWTIDHEDFPSLFFTKGNTDIEGFKEHGTAVLGEMCSVKNDYGVTGIAHEAKCGTVSFFDGGVPNALALAASKLKKGDVMLIELQATGPTSGEKCECNCSQFEQIAMEFWQTNFDVVQAAVARGITVVTAAGNGSQNLDASRYNGLFDRKIRDSGTIFVGGSDSGTGEPHCWTNYGTRLDTRGWGDSVTTTGYGDLGEKRDNRSYYTDSFKGTSSSAPKIAAAAALTQSIYFERNGKFLDPLKIRELLVNNATSQAPSKKNIGPLPDMKKIIAALDTSLGNIASQKIGGRKGTKSSPKKLSTPSTVSTPMERNDTKKELFLLEIAAVILLFSTGAWLVNGRMKKK